MVFGKGTFYFLWACYYCGVCNLWGGAGLGTVDCGVVTLNVIVNNSLGFLPLLCIGVFGGGRARLGQQTSSLAGGKSAGASWDLLLLHINVKLNSSNCSGRSAQQIILGEIK